MQDVTAHKTIVLRATCMKTSDLKSAPNSRHSIMHCIVKACRKGHATAAAAAAGVRKAINTKYPHCDVINDEQWNESGAKFKKRNNSQPYEYLILVLLMNAWNCVPLTRNTFWYRNDYYIRDKWVLTTLVFSLNKHRKNKWSRTSCSLYMTLNDRTANH